MVNQSSVCILVLLVLAAATNQANGISCFDAISKLIPCQSYLLGAGGDVSVPCCQGAASLNQLVGSDPSELKGLCQCLKQTALAMGVNVDRAKQLPQLCKITVPVPIDPNVNCDSL